MGLEFFCSWIIVNSIGILEDKVNANRIKTHCNKGFSGPILSSMIPPEDRSKSKNFETQEPTSPKVSCMDQIKHKKKISKKKQASFPKEFKPEKINKTRPVSLASELKKKPSVIRKIFGPGRKSDASINYTKPQLPDRAPSRDTFANFDWTTAQIAPGQNRDIFCD